jgi:hypothetical protein
MFTTNSTCRTTIVLIITSSCQLFQPGKFWDHSADIDSTYFDSEQGEEEETLFDDLDRPIIC